jgi:hypothetical protein
MTKLPLVQVVSYEAIERILSARRLEAYRLRSDEPLEAVFGRYRWNVALCVALYPALGLLEVAFRNSVHIAITALCGTAMWYDGGILLSREQDAVNRVKEELNRQKKPEEPDRIVAELTFGFWSSLLSGHYEQRLWTKLLRRVFPHMPKRRRHRGEAARRFHDLRLLRNRVSHHEPIYKQHNLLQRYDEIEEAIGWIEPAALRMLPIGESFRDVLARGDSFYSYSVDLDAGRTGAQ